MKQGKIIVAALGLPFSPDRKRVLLTQRHAPKYPNWHHKWQLAGGGLNFGEAPEEAVKRELWEELHVRARIVYPHPILKSNVWSQATSDEGMDTEVILITYLADIGDQVPDLKYDPDWETEAYAWYTLDQVKRLDALPQTLEIVAEAHTLLAKHEIMP